MLLRALALSILVTFGIAAFAPRHLKKDEKEKKYRKIFNEQNTIHIDTLIDIAPLRNDFPIYWLYTSWDDSGKPTDSIETASGEPELTFGLYARENKFEYGIASLKTFELNHGRFAIIVKGQVIKIFKWTGTVFHRIVQSWIPNYTDEIFFKKADVNFDGYEDVVLAGPDGGVHGNWEGHFILYKPGDSSLAYSSGYVVENLELDLTSKKLRSLHFSSAGGNSVKSLYEFEGDSLREIASVNFHPDYDDPNSANSKYITCLKTFSDGKAIEKCNTLSVEVAWKKFETTFWDSRKSWAWYYQRYLWAPETLGEYLEGNQTTWEEVKKPIQ